MGSNGSTGGSADAARSGLASHYPQALGAWPACILLLAFSWTELVYPNAASPVHIAALAIAYSALTWTGMLLFGRDAWLQNAEVFSLVFGTFARFAPTEARNGRLLLRPFGAGLLDPRPVSPSLMAFVLLLLASVLYDGLIGTGEWAAFEGALRARWPGLGDLAIRSIGLPAFWLLFAGAYLGICAVMSWVASGRPAPLEVARSFALTLIPIAIGYHVAHYLVFLLVQGQYIIPLLSDPLGRGWNLFGTAGYRVDIAVAGARFAWYTALGAIVAGHVLAVYLAHLRAMAVFAPARVALGTQVALTALMVVYTFVGLSITAEPITESRIAAEPAVAAAADAVAIPADAVLPEAPSGRLQPVGPGKSATSQARLQGTGLRLPRRHENEPSRSALRLRIRLSLGCAGRRRGRALRSPRRRRHRSAPPRACSACASAGSMLRPSPSASATSISCARSWPSRSTWRECPRSRSGAPS